jgi:hypothetical protein
VRREWIAVIAGCALGALWLDFSTLHAMHTADSFMSVLISLVKWTPYYWGQDRFGMLLPLLAWPVGEPLLNLLVQTFFQVFTTLLAPFVVVRVAGFRGATCLVGGALGVAVVFATIPAEALPWIIFNPIGLSLVLACVGDELIDTRAWPAGFVLLVVALWVNIGVLLLVPVIVLFTRKGLVKPAVAWGVAAALARLAMRLWGQRSTRLNPEWPTAWPHAWWELLKNAWTDWGVVFFVAVLAVLAVLGVARRAVDWKRLGGVAGACAVYWLLVGTSRHVADNAFNSRYLAPIALLLPATLWAAAATHVALKRVGVVCAAIVVTAAALKYGPANPRALIEQRFLAREQQARAAGCTHVAGRYWDVWPIELMSLMEHEPIIWAVSDRSDPTQAEWKAVAPAKWCAVAGDAEVDDAVKRYGLSVATREPSGAFDTLSVQPTPP